MVGYTYRPLRFHILCCWSTLSLNMQYYRRASSCSAKRIFISTKALVEIYTCAQCSINCERTARASICRLAQGQSGLGDTFRRINAALYGLERSGGQDHRSNEQNHRQQDCDLRLRAIDERCDLVKMLRVWGCFDWQYVGGMNKDISVKTHNFPNSRLRIFLHLLDCVREETFED